MMFADRLLALALVAAVLAAVWLGLTWRSRRFRRRMAGGLLVDGRPLVLAVFPPDWVPGQAIQKPALEGRQPRYPGAGGGRGVDALAPPARGGRFWVCTV